MNGEKKVEKTPRIAHNVSSLDCETPVEKVMKVLIIDKSAVNRRQVIRHLGEVGFSDYVEAGDENEAFSKLEEFSDINLVMCDWELTDNKSGYEFLQDFRKSHSDEYFIMVASKINQQDLIKTIKNGANSIILRPFDKEIFSAKIKKAISSM